MVAEISRVRVGDTEASVLPLVQRYGGFKWSSGRLPPKEEWIDKDEYDYQQNRVSDYRYALEVNPFGAITLHPSQLAQAIREVRSAVPERLRPVLGMRDWIAEADVSIRGGRVQSVLAMTLFAGRSEWLGHSWKLADGMPEHDMRQKTYAVGAGTLTMGEGGGETIDNYFTPKASEEEAGAARQFNRSCWSSIKGCKGLCEVAPRALEYLTQHPEIAWNIIPPKCP